MNREEIESHFLQSCVKAIREMGYPDANEENIFTDKNFIVFTHSILSGVNNVNTQHPDVVFVVNYLTNKIKI